MYRKSFKTEVTFSLTNAWLRSIALTKIIFTCTAIKPCKNIFELQGILRYSESNTMRIRKRRSRPKATAVSSLKSKPVLSISFYRLGIKAFVHPLTLLLGSVFWIVGKRATVQRRDIFNGSPRTSPENKILRKSFLFVFRLLKSYHFILGLSLFAS